MKYRIGLYAGWIELEIIDPIRKKLPHFKDEVSIVVDKGNLIIDDVVVYRGGWMMGFIDRSLI